MPRLDGIDVSHWDGTVDWSAVRGAESIQLVAAKATEGMGDRDPQFAANWAGMRAAGFRVRIAYHFATGDPPEEQAAWFAATIADAGGPLLAGEGSWSTSSPRRPWWASCPSRISPSYSLRSSPALVGPRCATWASTTPAPAIRRSISSRSGCPTTR